ncbi:CU044_2847 family protein [Streptomyces sp. NRRL S-1022]|uniref:CU044_2847 family protein n=1 Tax=Streptomyces sp. NRRL S-1022 TaxID=1463880 RepID=UPI0004C1E970|nr:CU044_2847 family protein [Streptomyces sp. NRRL S-1022]
MVSRARIPLEGGGCFLAEGPAAYEGPVKAGRVDDAVHQLPTTLQEALGPVTERARLAPEQLREVRPDEVVIEFGVDLSVSARAVITEGQAGCHLDVTVSWKGRG